MSFVRYNIGNGRDTRFWIDNWLGTGALIQNVGEVGPSLLGITRSACVADVIRDGAWNLRNRRNRLVRDHVIHIRTLPVPHPTDPPDQILWRHDADTYKDVFSMKHTWNELRKKGSKKDWAKLVWSPLSLPRYSFITWLAVLDKLPTGERAVRWGQQSICPLCGDPWETRDHLFFECSYSHMVWSQLSGALLGNAITTHWAQTVDNLLRNQRSKEVNTLTRFLFQAAVYHLWRERNGRNHGRTHTPAPVISNTIKDLLTQRLKAKFRSQEELSGNRLWTAWTQRQTPATAFIQNDSFD